MSPAGGFGPWAFRMLAYMPAVTARDAQARREGDRIAKAFAALVGVAAASWSERIAQINGALDLVEQNEAMR